MLTAIVATICRDVIHAYYFNDDFQFYRPVIEIYFFIGRRVR